MTNPDGDQLARIEFGRERAGHGKEEHEHDPPEDTAMPAWRAE